MSNDKFLEEMRGHHAGNDIKFGKSRKGYLSRVLKDELGGPGAQGRGYKIVLVSTACAKALR